MSIESMAIALHHSQASGTAKLVLIGIANHDGDAGSFPKVATLARYANVHPRRVSEAIQRLLELGEIQVDVKGGGMKSGPRAVRSEVAPNMYYFTLECPPNCDRTSRHQLLNEQGQALKFGRSYQGAYEGPREKDPEAVERGRRAWAKRNGDLVGPSDGNSTSDENSTRSSDENSTSPSDGNSTTNNPHKNPHENPALVPSVTREIHSSQTPVEKSAYCETGDCGKCQWAGCQDDCHQGIRSIVPALPRARPRGDDATPGTKDVKVPPGLTEEQKSRNKRGAAAARAALRGESPSTEAKDDGVRR